MTEGLRISLFPVFLAGRVWLSPRRVRRDGWRRITAGLAWLNQETRRSRVTACVLTWLIALGPMLDLAYLVRHYAVELPTLDDWEMAPLIVDAHNGRLQWASIFAQQQEARTVLPKLIFIL